MARNKTLNTNPITGRVFFIWKVIAMSRAIVGADALIAQLKRNTNLDDVKRVVKMNASELERKMKRNASFTKGYQTGETKRSIGTSVEGDGMSAVVGPKTHYSPYLE